VSWPANRWHADGLDTLFAVEVRTDTTNPATAEQIQTFTRQGDVWGSLRNSRPTRYMADQQIERQPTHVIEVRDVQALTIRPDTYLRETTGGATATGRRFRVMSLEADRDAGGVVLRCEEVENV
jgi:hypothetical protein